MKFLVYIKLLKRSAVMEINSLASNESSDVPSCEATSPDEMCRLRNGLNENCLLNVFCYLEIEDLFTLCDMDTYFKELITKWTFTKKVFNLPGIHPNELSYKREDNLQLIEIFKVYGKSIRKFKIEVASLPFLLEMIIEYCEPATFTEINWEITGYDKEIYVYPPVGEDLLNQSLPFFSNLRKFEVTNTHDFEFNDVFMKILSSATNLEILNVFRVDLTGEWWKSITNLRELHIYCYPIKNLSVDDLVNCLKINNKLKVFRADDFYDKMPIIGNVLSESCPYLEDFSDQLYEIPYKTFDLPMINHYNFLSKFSHLKRVELTSFTTTCCDLYYPLKILGEKDIVELIIFTPYPHLYDKPIKMKREVTSEIMKRPFPFFLNLQTLEIKSFVKKSFEFIFHLVKHLKNLKMVKIRTHCKMAIHKILEFAPSIETMDLSGYHNDISFQRGTLKNIVLTMRKIRQMNTDHHLLNLVLKKPELALDETYDTKDIIFSYVGDDPPTDTDLENEISEFGSQNIPTN